MASDMTSQEILKQIAALQTGVPAAPAVTPAQTVVPDPNKPKEENLILGLSPNEFSAIAGGIAAALAPQDTWQRNLGAFGRAIGLGAETEKRVGAPLQESPLVPGTEEAKPKKSKLNDKVDLSESLIGV